MIMCPGCRALFGVCDEVDTLITDLKELTTDGVAYFPEGRLCPSCQSVRIVDFIPADFDRLSEEGFTESDLYRCSQPFPIGCKRPDGSVPIRYSEHLARIEQNQSSPDRTTNQV